MIRLYFFIIWIAFSFHAAAADTHKKWVVYYDDEFPATDFLPFDVIIFDAIYHPPLEPLLEKNKTLLGYINLGEVENIRPFFDELKAHSLFLMENENWPGSYFVDLRNEIWVKHVIEEQIPAILHQGFDGLFFDTLDNAQVLETSSPEEFAGMQAAAIQLVKAIRLHYPDIKLMLNRGYSILPDVAGEVDMVLAESLYSTYNFKKKAPEKRSEDGYLYDVALLKKAQKAHPTLEVFTLDYWPVKDQETIRDIYKMQRENGFIPYVSTVELDRIIKEPK